MGQFQARSAHAERSADAPAAQCARGLLSKHVEGRARWAQSYAVLSARRLHLFASERAAQEWSTPTAVIDLAHTLVSAATASYQTSALPSDAITLETPSEQQRLDVQNGQTSFCFRVVTDGAAGECAQSEWLRRLRVASREPWQADGDAKACPRCSSKFDIFNRRHHCRRCGQIVCEPCGAYTRELPELAYVGPQRVCRACFADNSGGGAVPPPTQASAEAAAEAQRAALMRQAARDGRREPAPVPAPAAGAGGGGGGGGGRRTYGLGAAY